MMVIGPVSGYSVQARISLDVAEIINNRRINFWFAAEFHASENADTSNPLRFLKSSTWRLRFWFSLNKSTDRC